MRMRIDLMPITRDNLHEKCMQVWIKFYNSLWECGLLQCQLWEMISKGNVC